MKLPVVLLLLCTLFLTSCTDPPTTLKTLDLTPSTLFVGRPMFGGKRGLCVNADPPPPSTFSAGANQLMVGFDNFFSEGTFCNRLRAQVFRGHVDFDVSQFDSIVSANIIFDTEGSVERITETIGQNPAKSYATILGLATPPVTDKLLYDADVPLGNGPSFNFSVTSQVKSWLDGSHPRAGFVLAGPTDLPDAVSFPENNEAKVSGYGNFKLRVVDKPSLNPRAPQ
ncbi:MAG TPA: hypothetical protein VNA22_07775 [Pyrinomonadaceae bacterium]|nr:hypothetical protein [Pyrinomonadaceae bacterium]